MIRVGLVIYPGFQVLGLAVSAVFETANDMNGPSYELAVVSEHGGIVRSSLGFGMETSSFKDARYDTLIVIGNNHIDAVSEGLVDFLRASVATTRRIHGGVHRCVRRRAGGAAGWTSRHDPLGSRPGLSLHLSRRSTRRRPDIRDRWCRLDIGRHDGGHRSGAGHR